MSSGNLDAALMRRIAAAWRQWLIPARTDDASAAASTPALTAATLANARESVIRAS